MKLVEADKVEQAIKDYWKAQVDKLPKPGNVRDHDDFVDRLNSYIEHNHGLLRVIDELPSAEPDTTTHDSNVVKKGGNDEDRTSGDCISRQQAIDALLGITAMRNTIPLDSAIFNIKKLPSAQPEPHWVPCSERLPEEYGEFLVTYKSDGDQMFMDIVEYEPSFEFDHEKNRFKGNWLFADDCRSVNPEVLAWMPLPERYSGK